VVETTTELLDPLINQPMPDSPYDLYTPDVPLVHSFMPPAEEHEI